MAQSTLIDLIKSRHPSYNLGHFSFLWDAHQGGLMFGNPKYLERHMMEHEELYAERVKHLYYLNYLKSLNQLVVDYVFQHDEIRRDNSDAPFLQNVDRIGTPINSFMRMVALRSIVTGLSFIVVDTPDPGNDDVQSREDERTHGIAPYWAFRDRRDVLNWELDELGEPLWVLVREGEPVGASYGETLSMRGTVQMMKLWTRDDWTLIKVEGDNQSAPRVKVLATVAHRFGRVPIIPFYGDKLKEWVGSSWNEDTAPIAKALMNVCSLRMEYNYTAAIEQKVFPGDEDDIRNLTTGNLWLIAAPPDSPWQPYVMSCSGKAAEILRQQAIDLRDEIYRLAKQRILNTSAAADGASGTSKNEDFRSTQTNLANLASECERVENRAHLISMSVAGEENAAHYPMDFNASSVDSAIDRVLRVQAIDTTDEVYAWNQKDLIERFAKSATAAEKQSMIESIDAKFISGNETENLEQK